MRGYHNNIKKTSLKDVPNKMFNSMFHKPLGQDIYGFLRLDLTIIRMIDAANLNRASVDPICDDIYKTFQYEFEKITYPSATRVDVSFRRRRQSISFTL